MGACASRMSFFCEAMQKKGQKVVVLTTHPNYPQGRIFSGRKNSFFHTEVINDVTVWRVFFLPFNPKNFISKFASQISFALSLWLFFFRIKRYDFRALMVQTPPLPLALSAIFMAKFLQKKIIVNFSDLYPQALLDLGILREGCLANFLFFLERTAAVKADLITGQSAEIMQYWQQKGFGEKFILYRNGVCLSKFKKQNYSPENSNVKKIIYAGLLGFSQNLFDVCKNVNFEKLGFEFHIYGEGAEKEKIKALLQEDGRRGIFLHEPVEHEQIPVILQNFDIALIPTRKRILGTVPSKIYEALAAGLFIAYLGEGEGAELAALNGFALPPGDYEGLKRKLTAYRNGEFSKTTLSEKKLEDNLLSYDKGVIFDEFYERYRNEI